MKNSRAVLLLLLANSISGIAQGISMLAIPWYFTGIIHQEELFGMVYLAVTAISLPWGLYGGTLIDRYNRKTVFLVINLCGLALVGGIAATGWLQDGLHWMAVAAVFAITVFVYNIHYPNLYAFAQEITPKENYGRITSLIEIQGQLTFTLAGAGAAILLKGTEETFSLFGKDLLLPVSIRPWTIYEVFTLDAVTYLLAFLLIRQIKFQPVEALAIDTSSLKERIKTGFTFLKKHPVIFHFGNASLLVFLTVMLWGTYVLPVYVDSYLKKGGEVYALADMAFSFGALIAGIITTRIFTDKSTVKGIIILSVIAGMMYSVLAINKMLPLFYVAVFIIGACNSSVRIQRVTYIFQHIPNRVLGRAGSVFFVLNVLLRLLLIGLFTFPFFHQQANVVYATGILAVVCFAGAVILGINYKSLVRAPEVQ